MHPEAGPSVRKQLFRILFFFAVILTGACDDDKPDNGQQTDVAPAAEPLPVREWYPTPKHQQARRGFAQAPAHAANQVAAPPSYGVPPVQQSWSGAPQVVYVYPQVAGQPQVYNPALQWQYSAPQPVVPQPYQTVPAYQFVQQPWGLPAVIVNNSGTNTPGNVWQQPGTLPQWGSPAMNNYPGWGTGQHGVAPDVNTSGYVW
jgi:hypothetical protein